VSAHIALYVWRVPARKLPLVLGRMAIDRGRWRRTPGVRFAKLLGTAGQFAPARPDLTRWVTLVVSGGSDVDASPVARSWRALASAYCRLDLTAQSARGSWAGHRPFTEVSAAGDGLVLALTRARLRPSQAVAFWRASASVAAATRTTPGLLASFGIGEAPIGWQGTVTLWRSGGDLEEFAYRHPSHRNAIQQTRVRRWYAEELFARFAVRNVVGDPGVLGWAAEREAS
jgi:hypothetical protein